MAMPQMKQRMFKRQVWRLTAVWLLLAFLALPGQDGPSLELSVPDQVSPGAVFSMSLHVINARAAIKNPVELPVVKNMGMQLVPNSTGRLVQLINGRRSVRISYTILGQVIGEGDRTIPPVTIEFEDGTQASTEPVTLTVRTLKADKDFSAELTFDPPVVVPGQHTVLRYTIMTKDDASVHPDRVSIRPPEAANSVEQLRRSEGRAYDNKGNAWETLTFSWRLSFVEAGEHTVSGQQRFARLVGFGGRRHVGQIAVKPATVIVKDFPAQGRPAGFSGLLGPLSVTAELEREQMTMGEGSRLHVTITGPQSLLLSRPPDPSAAGQGYRVRYLESEDVPGGRRFSWNIEALRVGDWSIPPFQFDYFDPEQQSYEVASSESLVCTILPGRRRDLAIGGDQRDLPSSMTVDGGGGSAAVVLPAPLRGQGGVSVSVGASVLAALVALLGGLALALVGRQKDRQPKDALPDRGIVQAIRQGDLEKADGLLHQWLYRVSEQERALIEEAITAVEAGRFGGGQISEDLQNRLQAWERGR